MGKYDFYLLGAYDAPGGFYGGHYYKIVFSHCLYSIDNICLVFVFNKKQYMKAYLNCLPIIHLFWYNAFGLVDGGGFPIGFILHKPAEP